MDATLPWDQRLHQSRGGSIRIIDAATAELLRELTLDETKRYQGTGRPPGRPPKKQ